MGDTLREQWRYWIEEELRWLDRDTIPLYHTTGNHTAYDQVSEEVFKDVLAHLPRNGPRGQKGLSYFVRRDDLLLVFVNTLWSRLGGEAFPDSVPTGDIDFHVILKSELIDDERSALESFHESLADQFPPLGGELDGYYILLEDARCEEPLRSQMWRRATDESWALHREHIRAGRCIVLCGAEPTGIYPPASWPELERALYGELDYVERHLRQYPDYCILNLCRLIYSSRLRTLSSPKLKPRIGLAALYRSGNGILIWQ